MKNNISVIIPVFNGEKTIVRALASLISNLDYIYEIIVVDDYSSDNTIKVVKKFRKVFKNLKIMRSFGYRNPGVARKTGICEASGEWITFLDADDCLTASSLKYVSKNLSNSTLLLCCETIYYESGNFDPDAIEHSEKSCGGNFYNRQYLIDNSLYPDNDLILVEDEYFNEKVIKHIELSGYDIEYYDYPVYEVHHDIDEGLSYALSNWVDYLCKYRLLYKQKIVNDFLSIQDKPSLCAEYIENFIFCFFLAEGMLIDKDIGFDFDENKKYFKQALDFYSEKFKSNIDSIILFYNNNYESVKEIHKSAIESIGFEFDNYLSFDKFIEDCIQ